MLTPSISLALVVALAAPPDAARTDARRAQAAMDAGDPAQAAAWWRAAVTLDPTLGHRLGLADALAAREATCAEAAAVFAAAAADCGERCGEVETARTAAAKRCAVALRATAAPRGARITFDGVPITGPVWAGVRRVTATWADGTTRVRTVCLSPGKPAELVVDRSARTAVDPTLPDEQRALAHQEAAFGHVEAGAACEAAAEFAAAYAARAEPAFVYNEAMAHALDPDRCAEAIGAFDRFVLACPDCPQVWAARTRRGELVGGCQGVLVVELPTPDASVWVDGEPSPTRSERLPGTYRVTVQAPGYHPAEMPAPVERGQTRTVELAMMPVAVVETPPPEPLARTRLPALPPEPPAPDRTWLIVSAGVGAAGLVAGGAFTLLAREDQNTFYATEAKARRDPDNSYREALQGHLDAFFVDRALAVTGWAIAGAGLTTAALLWLLEEEPRVQVSPSGVGVGGVF